MQQPFSFYVVFNPLLNGENQSYKTQAHEFFHKLKNNLSMGDPNTAHLYWGKLKMSSYDEVLNFENFQKAHEYNRSIGADTHLFISDFHHFWVAKIESVHKEVFDKENTLPFYDGKNVEIWFKVSDMDLVSSEYVETGYYLENLYAKNEFCSQELESINPYLSGLRYPLIVQDKLSERYFLKSQAHERPRALCGNPLIEHPGESGKVVNNVQTYVLPPAIYGKLSERVKKTLIAVEMEIHKKDRDREDLNVLIVSSYRKMLEDALNDTFVKFVQEEAPGKVFESGKRATLEEIAAVIENPVSAEGVNLDFLFKSKLGFYRYCRNALMPGVRERGLVDMPEGQASHKEAMMMRNLVLGVGCKGILNSLVCLYHEDEFMDSYFRKVA